MKGKRTRGFLISLLSVLLILTIMPFTGYVADGGATDDVYIDTNGNVGIGTTTPASKLEVVGNVEADGFTINGVPVGTSSDSYWSASGGNIYYSSGYVGIWTTSPGYELDVAGTINASTAIKVNGIDVLTSYTETDPVFTVWDKSTGISITESQIADLNHFTSADETDPQVGSNSLNYIPKWNGTALVTGTIYDNGNVGIGTTSPSRKLEVAGYVLSNAATAQLRLENSGTFRAAISDNGDSTKIFGDGDGTNPVITIQNGNVKIGTGTPSQATGSGDLYVSGIIENKVDSANALLIQKSDGTDIFVVDTSFGDSSAPPVEVRTSYNNNLAIGRYAGQNLTSGATHNTFIGHEAGASNTGGYWNTFVGRGAGNTNTTNWYNTYIGEDAGRLASGNLNTYVGGAAGYDSDGSSNTFVGEYTGIENKGASNTFIGREAGYGNTAGGENVYIGHQSGKTGMSTGAGNTFLGAGTDGTADVSYSIVFGANALATASNQMVVGGADTYGISEIYLGEGVTNATPAGVTVNATGGSGTNIAGANLILAGGKGTGSGAGGSIFLQTAPAGSSGTSLNSLVTRLTIDSSGDVGIGTTDTGGYKLYVAGTVYAEGGYYEPSDIRFKENISPIVSPLNKILNIQGVSFNWKRQEYKDKRFPEGRHYGVIGQEIEDVLPEIVKEGSNGEKRVSYTEMIPVLIEAVKEQQKIIERQQKEIEELKSKFERMGKVAFLQNN